MAAVALEHQIASSKLTVDSTMKIIVSDYIAQCVHSASDIKQTTVKKDWFRIVA